jgi:hypothetical protein
MGFYIQTDRNVGKATRLLELYPDRVATGGALTSFEDVPEGKTAVCVVSNPMFDAAGIAYDSDEFEAFSEPGDPRSKTWLLVDTDLANELCPDYAKRMAKVG